MAAVREAIGPNVLFPVQRRVSDETKNHPYEIKGLRVAEISLIIEA